MTHARALSRVFLGFLVAYVLAFQGMAGAFASARHAGPLPSGVLCSGEAVPGEGAPQSTAHACGCDAFCGAAQGASLPPPASNVARALFFARVTHDAPAPRPLDATRFASSHQPRAPPFAV